MAAMPQTLGVRVPAWSLTYKGVAISKKIERMVESITYISHAGGASPELEVELEDRDKRWQGPWMPTRGDIVALAIGYANESLVSCGSFQVDEVELKLPPDTVHLRCIAAYISDALRTPKSVGYENQTLLQIASKVAAQHGWTVTGAPEALNTTFARVTQSEETDLDFLQRLAEEHNYEFTIRPPQLIFYSRTALENRPATSLISRADVTEASFKAKTHQVYAAAQVNYFNPATKSLISQTVSADGGTPTVDTHKQARRCENGQQATLKANAALYRNNMLQTSGRLTMPGTTSITAGTIITVGGFGAFDGNYFVSEARHRLERSSGYTTEIVIRTVGAN
ncbi:MAG TPA: contractile injection system protein, VgrG/Pvc8 family [Candidatus Binataceae bacterium]|jgi:phage protein D|nr:contractile injection system protein, VgrG/Pvc8 family [Candidatus Binataceae bacterium]